MNISGQGNWMDKLFHKKLSGFEVSPEDHVWEGIAKRLDDSQKRPALFGNWWTVLLSIVMLLLVTGVAAYMMYKRSYQQKVEKNQNKDLPYIDNKNDEDLTAKMNPSDIKKTLSAPYHTIKLNNQAKIANPSSLLVKKEIKNEIAMRVTEKGYNSEIETKPSALVLNANTEQSAIENQLQSNDLIVSTDKDFYISGEKGNKPFSYSYLPLKESFLRKENEQLTSPRLVDGCNVLYRNNNSHFFLDIYYAPEIANRTLKTNDPALQSYVEKRSNSEKPVLSYSAGIKASFIFSNGITLRSGLSYSNNSERFDFVKETQTLIKTIKDQNGNVIRTEVSYVVIMDKIYNSYKFLDIPILLGYEKDLKDFILSFNGGIGINVLSNQSGKIYKDVNNTNNYYLLENNGEANKPIFRTNAGMSLIGSIGLNYKYNERIMILFEPSARYYLHPLSDPSNAVSQNYIFLGMNVGLRYRIK